MAYPPESQIRLPLLKLVKDKKIHSTDEAEKFLANLFKLSTKQRNELKSSGGERLFLHKLRWSRTDLRVAGLIKDDPKPTCFQITKKGLKILKNPPDVITDRFLSDISKEFAKWRRRKTKSTLIRYFSKKVAPKSKTEEGINKEYKKIEYFASKKVKKLSVEEKNNLLEQYETRNKKPKRTKSTKSKRYDRDPKLAALMKDKYHHKCQICRKLTFMGKDGYYYTESHHVWPRSDGGPDIPGNILIVCPKCHRIFDSGNDKEQLRVYKILKTRKLFSEFKILRKKKVISNFVYRKLLV